MYDIITFGSATKDISVKPKNLTSLKYNKDANGQENVCLPLGSKIEVEEMIFNSGGGGTNTAVTFALQGFKTAFVGAVGKDVAGQKVIEGLKKVGIDTRFVKVISEKPTNHSVIILNTAHDRTILAYRGASDLLKKSDISFGKIKSRWLYLAPLSGLVCQEFADIVDFAVKNKTKIAINPSMAQLGMNNFSEILKKVDILFINEEEASFLTKIPCNQEKEIFKKIDEICPGIAVMTKGGDGVVVSDGKTIYSAVPPKETKVVDATGAGDSFASGFVSEFMRTNDIEKAIQLGMANSQGCLENIGAKNGLLKKGQDYNKVEVLKEGI